jgi:hypothetical protein
VDRYGHFDFSQSFAEALRDEFGEERSSLNIQRISFAQLLPLDRRRRRAAPRLGRAHWRPPAEFPQVDRQRQAMSARPGRAPLHGEQSRHASKRMKSIHLFRSIEPVTANVPPAIRLRVPYDQDAADTDTNENVLSHARHLAYRSMQSTVPYARWAEIELAFSFLAATRK